MNTFNFPHALQASLITSSNSSTSPSRLVPTRSSPLPAGEIGVLNGGGGVHSRGRRLRLQRAIRRTLARSAATTGTHSAEADKAALSRFIERLMRQLREPQPGSLLIVEHLAQMLLVEALRLHLAERLGQSMGWLYASANWQKNAVIAAMHGYPGRKCTLATLAHCQHVAIQLC